MLGDRLRSLTTKAQIATCAAFRLTRDPLGAC